MLQVVLMGSDIPGVDPAVLSAAFHALDSHQLVLGPACDGGFYLIGATVAPPDFLQVCISHNAKCIPPSQCRPARSCCSRPCKLQVCAMQGLTWSTDHVLHDTLAHALSLGLDVAPVSMLPQLQDIDTAQVPDKSCPDAFFGQCMK